MGALLASAGGATAASSAVGSEDDVRTASTAPVFASILPLGSDAGTVAGTDSATDADSAAGSACGSVVSDALLASDALLGALSTAGAAAVASVGSSAATKGCV